MSTIAGCGEKGYQDGEGVVAKFNYPTSITFAVFNGSLLVADTGNNKIRQITQKGTVIPSSFFSELAFHPVFICLK